MWYAGEISNQIFCVKKILYHTGLVLLLLSIPIVSSPDFDGTLSVFRVSPFQREFIRFVLVTIFFYLNLNVFLPKFYSKKRFLAFTLCIAISFGLMVALPYLFTSGTFFSQNPAPMEMRNPAPPANIPPPAPAQLMRFTVTNFPIFATRNVTRDIVSRLVMSRTGSGFKELIHNAKDSELFSLYGGAMAG